MPNFHDKKYTAYYCFKANLLFNTNNSILKSCAKWAVFSEPVLYIYISACARISISIVLISVRLASLSQLYLLFFSIADTAASSSVESKKISVGSRGIIRSESRENIGGESRENIGSESRENIRGESHENVRGESREISEQVATIIL